MVPGPSTAKFCALTAKISAQLPSSRVVSPCSGIASIAWYCLPSALPSSLPSRRQVQGDVALHLDGPDDEHPRRHQHRAALILVAGVDGRLHRRGIERDTVAFGAEIADVEPLKQDVSCLDYGKEGSPEARSGSTEATT